VGIKELKDHLIEQKIPVRPVWRPLCGKFVEGLLCYYKDRSYIRCSNCCLSPADHNTTVGCPCSFILFFVPAFSKKHNMNDLNPTNFNLIRPLDGLLPAIIQDADTCVVLMQWGYMNQP
jgi:hypothetical protein